MTIKLGYRSLPAITPSSDSIRLARTFEAKYELATTAAPLQHRAVLAWQRIYAHMEGLMKNLDEESDPQQLDALLGKLCHTAERGRAIMSEILELTKLPQGEPL